MMAQNLGELGTPETASRIAAMAGRTDLPMEIREEFVMALGTIKSEEAAHILDSLSNSRAAGLGEAARRAKAMRNPAGAGILLTTIFPETQATAAGLKRGDILVSYGGNALKSMEDLVQRIQGTQQDAPVQLEVLRGGQRMIVTVRGGKLGINGRYTTLK